MTGWDKWKGLKTWKGEVDIKVKRLKKRMRGIKGERGPRMLPEEMCERGDGWLLN